MAHTNSSFFDRSRWPVMSKPHDERKSLIRRSAQAFASLVSLLALTGCERWWLDWKMESLCKKDGGVKVYETVRLAYSEFGPGDQPLAKYIPISKSIEDYLGPDYRYVRVVTIIEGKDSYIEAGEGQLTRFYTAIYRRSDDYLLGESISYGRGGGDGFTFGFNPSGNACPLPRTDLIKSVFLKE